MKFRMVDRILDWQMQRSIAGIKALSLEEYCLRSRMGREASLPESLLMEALFQLGNWLIVLSSDFTQMGLLVRFEEVRFHEPLGPGQSLHMDVQVASYRSDGVVFHGVASSSGRTIATGKGCLAIPAALADFHDPDDLRVLFSQIHRPLAQGRE